MTTKQEVNRSLLLRRESAFPGLSREGAKQVASVSWNGLVITSTSTQELDLDPTATATTLPGPLSKKRVVLALG
jgi:hypothetical protein